MNNTILFVSPAKTYPVDEEGKPFEPARPSVSLAALTILGSLESEGFDVEFIDQAAEGCEVITPLNEHLHRYGLPDEYVIQRISETNPLALLVTSMFSNEQQVVDSLTARVKKSFPKLPIIAGGVHATIKPRWLLEQGGIDLVIQGEGEEIVPKVLKKIQSDERDFPGQVIRAPRLIQDLNRAWAFGSVLVKNEGAYRYDSHLAMRSSLYLHKTEPGWTKNFMLHYSKGCPTHCDFCATSQRDGWKIRHIGSDRMIADLKMLHESYDVNIFYNEADAFCFYREDFEFLKKVKDYRKTCQDFVLNNPNGFYVKVFFPAKTGYQLDEDFMDLLADAGFNVITISVETYNPRFNKKIDFDKISHEKIKGLISAIKKRDMKSEVYIMYAFPTETKDELYYDERMGQDLGADVLTFHTCTLFPGTEYYSKYVESGGLFSEQSYREMLKQGNTFYNTLSEGFNYTNIPADDLRTFRLRHRLNFS